MKVGSWLFIDLWGSLQPAGKRELVRLGEGSLVRAKRWYLYFICQWYSTGGEKKGGFFFCAWLFRSISAAVFTSSSLHKHNDLSPLRFVLYFPIFLQPQFSIPLPFPPPNEKTLLDSQSIPNELSRGARVKTSSVDCPNVTMHSYCDCSASHLREALNIINK